MKKIEEFVNEAIKELSDKSYEEIQEETAMKWAARSYVAFEAVLRSDNKKDQMGWFQIAEEYRHEALEHAALVENADKSNEILESVRSLIEEVKRVAYAVIYDLGINENDEPVESDEEVDKIEEENNEKTLDSEGISEDISSERVKE